MDKNSPRSVARSTDRGRSVLRVRAGWLGIECWPPAKLSALTFRRALAPPRAKPATRAGPDRWPACRQANTGGSACLFAFGERTAPANVLRTSRRHGSRQAASKGTAAPALSLILRSVASAAVKTAPQGAHQGNFHRSRRYFVSGSGEISHGSPKKRQKGDVSDTVSHNIMPSCVRQAPPGVQPGTLPNDFSFGRNAFSFFSRSYKTSS